MSAIDLIVAVLAVWQSIEIWHHGEIFASCRAHLQERENWLTRLLLCPFCLSLWISLFACILHVLALSWSDWFGFPLVVLAVARLANLGNDLTHAFCRTPGRNVAVLDDAPAPSLPQEEKSVPVSPSA